MSSKVLFKLSTKNLLVFLLLFIFSYEQQCISGKNCPVNQGMCVSNKCVCNEGYHTLLDKSNQLLLIYIYIVITRNSYRNIPPKSWSFYSWKLLVRNF